mgnify:CR=1 FL=1
MRIEEAISHYKYGISHDIFSHPVTTYAQMAVEALEKQIPKEPIYKENGNIECPSCNCEALRYHNYCWNCGQALKWGDAE